MRPTRYNTIQYGSPFRWCCVCHQTFPVGVYANVICPACVGQQLAVKQDTIDLKPLTVQKAA
jgi:Zn finger protein HypA/HybF involved in hydrogenase expression